MLQEAEALVKDVTALGRWPRDSKNNPNERSLIRRIRELRDLHASGALQSALDGAAQPTVIAQLEGLQRKFLHAQRRATRGAKAKRVKKGQLLAKFSKLIRGMKFRNRDEYRQHMRGLREKWVNL